MWSTRCGRRSSRSVEAPERGRCCWGSGVIPGGCSISENTVKNHVRNILEKLQLHSRMEAVVYAMREKILEIR
ncbi:response regulator transcription factor [Streptomyces exfoliatus]|uniref:response regulator transcription factor n=1 Tax=Streptomyces exfoliatus TaxID=1905 RepID=UPI0009975D13